VEVGIFEKTEWAGVVVVKYDRINETPQTESVKGGEMETSAVRNKTIRTARHGGGKANRKTPSDMHTRSRPKVQKWVPRADGRHLGPSSSRVG